MEEEHPKPNEVTTCGDSMAARLARQRQQRSILRTAAVEAASTARNNDMSSELNILRAGML